MRLPTEGSSTGDRMFLGSLLVVATMKEDRMSVNLFVRLQHIALLLPALGVRAAVRSVGTGYKLQRTAPAVPIRGYGRFQPG